MKPEILHTTTQDALILPGIHYEPEQKEVGILVVHGMSGNFLENRWAHIAGSKLASQGVGFLYAHNRGYGHINDIAKEDEQTKDNGYARVRTGAVYERFAESAHDIEAWIKEMQKLGYKKIVLLGHSLGCNKVLYYLHRNKAEGVVGVILASPPDMIGLAKTQPDYEELLQEAKGNIAGGKPRKLLSNLIWNWFILSSRTFLDLFEEEGPADNIPVLRNPDVFSELASVQVPILGIMGQYDDIGIRGLKEDLMLIRSRATGTPTFTKQFILGANHNYEHQEEQFADAILQWIQSTRI